MTVPVQRGAGSEDAVLNLVLDAVREVKDQVIRFEAHIGGRLDALDQRYVPRAEYEARHSDVRNLITRADAKIDAEATERKSQMEALTEKLTAARRYALTTSIAGLMAVVGLLALVLSNLR